MPPPHLPPPLQESSAVREDCGRGATLYADRTHRERLGFGGGGAKKCSLIKCAQAILSRCFPGGHRVFITFWDVLLSEWAESHQAMRGGGGRSEAFALCLLGTNRARSVKWAVGRGGGKSEACSSWPAGHQIASRVHLLCRIANQSVIRRVVGVKATHTPEAVRLGAEVILLLLFFSRAFFRGS